MYVCIFRRIMYKSDNNIIGNGFQGSCRQHFTMSDKSLQRRWRLQRYCTFSVLKLQVVDQAACKRLLSWSWVATNRLMKWNMIIYVMIWLGKVLIFYETLRYYYGLWMNKVYTQTYQTDFFYNSIFIFFIHAVSLNCSKVLCLYLSLCNDKYYEEKVTGN